MRRKSSFSIISFLSAILAVIFLVGCGNNSTSDSNDSKNNTNNTGNGEIKEEAQKPKEESKTFASADGIIELKAPDDWDNIDDLSPDANIQIGNLQKEQYTVTISENTIDFSDSFTLQEYSDIIIPSMEESIINAEVSEVTNITIDGNDAVQFHISGEVEKIKITYLITVVKTEEYFHQIISWSLKRLYPEYEDLYKSIANSLTEK